MGELTDELDGDTIDTFICTGPKSYCYTTLKGKKTVVKIKGFTLSYTNARKITFTSICELLKDEKEDSSSDEVTQLRHLKSAEKGEKRRKKTRCEIYEDENEEQSFIVTEIPRKICLDTHKTSRIFTKYQSKKFKVVYSKRYLIRSSLETLPFGWRGDLAAYSHPSSLI